MKNFALIGAAGFIAPRHLKAIKETGNNLIAAVDKFDSVGIMDSYFPDCHFFTEFERFDRHIEKIKLKGTPLDYVSVCSPNYLHDAHIRFGLRQGADVICEKPIVLNPWNIDALVHKEQETGKKVYSILQLRLHPSIIALREKVQSSPTVYREMDLRYITSRGKWYFTSWKGDITKSGGIATNIGVHFFDMLTWIFGEVKENIVTMHNDDTASGVLIFGNAKVTWFLSINENTLPNAVKNQGKRTFRRISIDGEEFEFSEGFTDLHTRSYEEILKGNGFGILESLEAIKIVADIRKKINS
jgi:UDP-N-acetyl-2-amino-2-deoxyglucuronate dehydrogenase